MKKKLAPIHSLASFIPSVMQQDLFEVVQPKTQKEKILDLLVSAGSVGVTNYEMNKTCFRYAARIHDLKNDGYIIKSVKMRGSMWVFILEGKA